MGRDEIGDTVQSVHQGTAFTLPTEDGTDVEKAAIWRVINKYKQVFGPPPLGGSKLRPMSIELKPGVAIPRPTPARRVSPDILQEIREDVELRISQGWMRKTVVGDRCRFASPVVAARQPGRTRRRICGDYRALTRSPCFTNIRPRMLGKSLHSSEGPSISARPTGTRATSSCDSMRKRKSFWQSERRTRCTTH